MMTYVTQTRRKRRKGGKIKIRDASRKVLKVADKPTKVKKVV
jgi:hypothetical protein